jgi:Fur family iron response transcriptional regulator
MMAENTQTRLGRDLVITMLERSGIAATEQRIEIGAVLFAQHQHLSAEQVLARLEGDGPHVSKATVYNTLKLFTDAGLLREVIVDSTKRFFDSNTQPHHHLFHTDTGRLQDVDPARVHITALPGISDDIEVLGIDVVIRVAPKAKA